MPIRCIIIDDEPLAIKLLENFIGRTSFLTHEASFLNPLDALDHINQHSQLVFLDIEMAELNGLELAKLIPSQVRIIFTTAYKQYAFDSYEVHAIDYLLKPISYTSFLKAVTRAKIYFEQDDINKTAIEESDVADSHFFVKCDYKLVRIDFDSILYIQALKDYVRIFQVNAKRPIIALITMKSLEEKLPVNTFCRVHRSYIVRIDKIDSIERNRIRLGDTLIPIAETKAESLMRLIKT